MKTNLNGRIDALESHQAEDPALIAWLVALAEAGDVEQMKISPRLKRAVMRRKNDK